MGKSSIEDYGSLQWQLGYYLSELFGVFLYNKHMLIGIDGNEANFEKKVGVHKQTYEILWGLYKLEDKKNRPNNYIIYLKNAPREDMPRTNGYWKYKILPGKGLWVLTRLMPALWACFFNTQSLCPNICSNTQSLYYN